MPRDVWTIRDLSGQWKSNNPQSRFRALKLFVAKWVSRTTLIQNKSGYEDEGLRKKKSLKNSSRIVAHQEDPSIKLNFWARTCDQCDLESSKKSINSLHLCLFTDGVVVYTEGKIRDTTSATSQDRLVILVDH